MESYAIKAYVRPGGTIPFDDWMQRLDRGARARIAGRIDRFRTGNLGVHRHLGASLYEAKMDFGPGYRIYFGIQGQTLVILLCGGDKSSQGQDIEQAQALWRELKGGRP